MAELLDRVPGWLATALLAGSVLLAPPAWFGSVEILSSLGLPWVAAGLVSGAYVSGRALLSLYLLARRHRWGRFLEDPALAHAAFGDESADPAVTALAIRHPHLAAIHLQGSAPPV